MNYSRTPFPQLDEATTIDEMRAAIERAQFTNPLIRNAIVAGLVAGLSPEDVYIQLSYHAVRALIATQRRLYDSFAKNPMPPMVLSGPDEG